MSQRYEPEVPIGSTGGGGLAAVMVQGNVANDEPDVGNPVKIGGRAVGSIDTGLVPAVGVGDRVDAAYTITGLAGVAAIGTIGNDAPDDGNPLKIGGRSAPIAGLTAVSAANDRTNIATNTRGALLTQLSGGALWTKSNTVLAAPVTTKLIFTGPAQLGRLSCTNADATASYAYVYDGTDNTGTLIDMFQVPASGTGVRDWTTEGCLAVAVGIYIEFSTGVTALVAPATGCAVFGIYQAGA
jgi:hypothetical protein